MSNNLNKPKKNKAQKGEGNRILLFNLIRTISSAEEVSPE